MRHTRLLLLTLAWAAGGLLRGEYLSNPAAIHNYGGGVTSTMPADPSQPTPLPPPSVTAPQFETMDSEAVQAEYQIMAAGTPYSPSSCHFCSHYTAGVDVGATRPGYASGLFALNDDSVGVSVRPYLGWEDSDGVGLRVRGWIYGNEHDALYDDPLLPLTVDLSAYTIDFDLYKRFCFDRTSLAIGAGPRVAELEFENPGNFAINWGGGGLSIFADLYHPFYVGPDSEWGWLAGGRLSYLSGEVRFASGDPYPQVDHVMDMGEAYIGLEYRRHFGWSDLVARFLVEHQVWHSNVSPPVGFDTIGGRIGWEW